MAPLPAWMFSGQDKNGDVVDVDDMTNQDGDAGFVDEEQQQQQNLTNVNLDDNEEDGLHNTNNNTEVVRRGSGFDSVHSEMIPKNGFYICKPYKKEIIAQQLNDNSPGANRRMAIIGALRDLGVKVFIIEAKSIQTTADILHHVQRVVGFVARENRTYRYNPLDMETIADDEEYTQATTASLGFQRCLLYQDKTGRLFNLMLTPHAMGPAYKFEEYLDTFSNVQAVSILAVLTRAFTCMMEGDTINTLQPAYLAMVLGMVFVEEMSLSWLNSSMLVRASPSVSAHTLTSGSGSDLFRKAVILCLILAGAASTSGNADVQKYLTVIGIGGACAVLLSNLGSRAWHFMAWKPLVYQGPMADTLSWFAAVGTGLMYPFMASRKVHVGGKAGVEHIILTSVIAAAVFIMSGLKEFQEFLIIQNEACEQDTVNIVVGGWWFVACIMSLWTMVRMPSMDHTTVSSSDNEPLLLASQASPVGFKVPSLPDYEMDSSLASTGVIPFMNVQTEFITGVVVACGLGLAMVWWGLSDWGSDAVDQIGDSTGVYR
eukprot:CAMPEP_0172439572 /NCGR_PEP_ID=MMETSP1065-20121228/508_1 /TAXON_ID=265537 /ORGANISM="Amphiprora paludosa, Strain CCMP125" /LENGTH=542 /DNA_ID=CAMNT_0013188271 /DNA_START=17 /DNA_END=1645 /DNA_ORIENTATION=-